MTTYEPNGSVTLRETLTSTINKVFTGGLPYGHYDAGNSYTSIEGSFLYNGQWLRDV